MLAIHSGGLLDIIVLANTLPLWTEEGNSNPFPGVFIRHRIHIINTLELTDAEYCWLYSKLVILLNIYHREEPVTFITLS